MKTNAQTENTMKTNTTTDNSMKINTCIELIEEWLDQPGLFTQKQLINAKKSAYAAAGRAYSDASSAAIAAAYAAGTVYSDTTTYADCHERAYVAHKTHAAAARTASLAAYAAAAASCAVRANAARPHAARANKDYATEAAVKDYSEANNAAYFIKRYRLLKEAAERGEW